MKKVAVLVLSLGISLSSVAQKKELKKAAKLVKSFKVGEANKALAALKETVKGTEYESQYYFLKGKNFYGKMNKKNYGKAYKEFYKAVQIEAEKGQKEYSEKSIGYMEGISDFYFNKYSAAVKNKNNEEAGKIMERYSYLTPQRRDILRLALLNYQEAKNNEKMAEVLELLLKKEKGNTLYIAKNVHMNKEDEFFTKAARDLAVKIKTHEAPREEKTEKPARLEYLNLLVRVYHQSGKSDKVLATLERAKKEFPKNAKIYKDYASIVYAGGDKQAYLKALEEALKIDPVDKDLWFNYGVISQDLKLTEKAVSAYEKVTEIDPNYRGAYINKGLTILAEEQSLIDELNNNLRNRKKYKEIDAKIKAMYLRAIPAFEKANELKADEGIKASLINLYNSVGQKDKAAALK
ncbi:hypothetical protein [Wenyingzhuangia sp. IMCC45574]